MTFVLCAVAYPAAVWGLGQLAFPEQAEGSLIHDRERQRDRLGADRPAVRLRQLLLPPPSAADYKADAAGGSNLGTKNPDLRKKVAERAEALKATTDDPAPVDLVTASGGGLDPHISPEAAPYQAARVAAARKLPVEQRPRADRPADRALRRDHRRPAAGQRAAAQPRPGRGETRGGVDLKRGNDPRRHRRSPE